MPGRRTWAVAVVSVGESDGLATSTQGCSRSPSLGAHPRILRCLIFCFHGDMQGRTSVAVEARLATAPASAEPTAAVTLKACRRLQFGQVLKVVGGTAEMGDWDPTAAPGEEQGWPLAAMLGVPAWRTCQRGGARRQHLSASPPGRHNAI